MKQLPCDLCHRLPAPQFLECFQQRSDEHAILPFTVPRLTSSLREIAAFRSGKTAPKLVGKLVDLQFLGSAVVVSKQPRPLQKGWKQPYATELDALFVRQRTALLADDLPAQERGGDVRAAAAEAAAADIPVLSDDWRNCVLAKQPYPPAVGDTSLLKVRLLKPCASCPGVHAWTVHNPAPSFRCLRLPQHVSAPCNACNAKFWLAFRPQFLRRFAESPDLHAVLPFSGCSISHVAALVRTALHTCGVALCAAHEAAAQFDLPSLGRVTVVSKIPPPVYGNVLDRYLRRQRADAAAGGARWDERFSGGAWNNGGTEDEDSGGGGNKAADVKNVSEHQQQCMAAALPAAAPSNDGGSSQCGGPGGDADGNDEEAAITAVAQAGASDAGAAADTRSQWRAFVLSKGTKATTKKERNKVGAYLLLFHGDWKGVAATHTSVACFAADIEADRHAYHQMIFGVSYCNRDLTPRDMPSHRRSSCAAFWSSPTNTPCCRSTCKTASCWTKSASLAS